jgi:hypothetical protein
MNRFSLTVLNLYGAYRLNGIHWHRVRARLTPNTGPSGIQNT